MGMIHLLFLIFTGLIAACASSDNKSSNGASLTLASSIAKRATDDAFLPFFLSASLPSLIHSYTPTLILSFTPTLLHSYTPTLPLHSSSQHRNTAGRVFGGYLMRVAFELGFSTAYLFSGTHPRFAEVDEVIFHKPVEVGDVVRLRSKVLYTSTPEHFDLVRAEAEAEARGERRSTTGGVGDGELLGGEVLGGEVLGGEVLDAPLEGGRYGSSSPSASGKSLMHIQV
jgi:hypothetical protein